MAIFTLIANGSLRTDATSREDQAERHAKRLMDIAFKIPEGPRR